MRMALRQCVLGINSLELARLQRVPRFEKTPFHLLNRRIELTDGLGAWQCIHELLLDEIYRFRSDIPNPRILDCGANVGLSIIYFKHLYPEAEIIAFEPDARIFETLERNVRVFGFADVALRCEAVWKENGALNFVPDGGFGGRTEAGALTSAAASVKAVRLRDFLDKPVSLLKIDIEGAELDVIEDCRDHLAGVERLFVEFHGRRAEPQRLDAMLAFFSRAGFRYCIKEAFSIAHPFIPEERQQPIYDLQLNIFGTRF